MSKLTKTLLASCLAFAVVSMSVFATMEDQRAQLAKHVGRQTWGKILVTILDAMVDANGKIDGEQIGDDTIDEDSIDFGSGTDQVDFTDITTGNIATATAFTIDVSGAGLDLTLSTDSGAGEDLVVDTDNVAIDAAGVVTINDTWDMNTATGLDGEAIDADTIDEDSIDWGSATDQVDFTDITTGNIATATAFTIDVSGAGLDLTLSTDSAAGEDLIVDTDNVAIDAAGVVTINDTWDMNTAAGLEGESIVDDTIDEDAIDWGAGTDEVDYTDITTGDILVGANVTIGGNADDAVLTLQAGDGTPDAGDDFVFSGHNMALTALGAMSFNQSTTIGTVGDDETMTFQAHAGAPDAGDDVIFDFHNWGLTAGGAMTFVGQAGSIATAADTALTLTGGDDGAAAGEDVIIDGHNFAVAVGGAVTWPSSAGSLATQAATALTIYGGDDGADSGEDVIIDSVDWGVTNDGLRTIETNIGTAGSGCTAVHWGDGKHIMAEITITTADIDVVANANEGHGWLIYTLPAGACVITNSYLDYELNTSDACTADQPESALGSVIATGAIATLTATTMEDISDAGSALILADCNGTAEVSSHGPVAANGKFVVETGDAHTVHVNFADNWAGADDNILLTGTVRLSYTYMD